MTRFMVLFTVGALLAAGCGQAQPRAVTMVPAAPSAHLAAAHAGAALSAQETPAAEPEPHAEHPGTPPAPAALRGQLEQLLGDHVILALRFMRAKVDQSPAFVQAANAALVDNTADLTEVVGSVYGPEGGSEFQRLWVDHVQSMFLYTDAVVDGDQAARQDARTRLDSYRQAFGAFVEGATQGQLPADAVAETLRVHIDQMLGHIDAYVAGDYAGAYRLQREAYAHMFPTGSTLAGAFAEHLPGEFPVPVDTAPDQLRSALGMLLGEHVALAIDAMRAGVDGRPDFTDSAGALNANTADLTAAIETLFGPEGAARFNSFWADHIDLFVDYTVALAGDDQAGRDTARAGLVEYQDGFGALLSELTGGRLPAEALSQEMQLHDDQLLQQIDAYADEDYNRASELSFGAYQHMFSTAANLAEAIEANLGGTLPTGGAQTGGGGTAREVLP
jgi:hypothetical protein